VDLVKLDRGVAEDDFMDFRGVVGGECHGCRPAVTPTHKAVALKAQVLLCHKSQRGNPAAGSILSNLCFSVSIYRIFEDLHEFSG
jgi:hypothetical protein